MFSAARSNHLVLCEHERKAPPVQRRDPTHRGRLHEEVIEADEYPVERRDTENDPAEAVDDARVLHARGDLKAGEEEREEGCHRAGDEAHEEPAEKEEVGELKQQSLEFPILLYNSHAGNHGCLLNPKSMVGNRAQHLAAPHPAARDELLRFTCEFLFWSSYS